MKTNLSNNQKKLPHPADKIKNMALRVGLLAALCALPAMSVRAAFSNFIQNPWQGGVNHFYGNTLITSGGTYSNNGASASFSSLPASTGPMFGWDLTPGVNRSGDYYYGVGELIDITSGSATINNSGTMQGYVTGSGNGFAAGCYAILDFGATGWFSNSGLMDGEFYNNEGAAAGLWVGGPATIYNNSGATCSATATYYASAIYANEGGGSLNCYNFGTAKATSTSWGGNAYASAIDLFTSGTNSPIVCENHSTIQANGTGGSYGFIRGVSEWSNGGKVTFKNWGTINASMTAGSGECDGVYVGANNADVYFYNYGTISQSNSNGFAVGVENDTTNGNIYFYNSGTIQSFSGDCVQLGNFGVTNTSGTCYFENAGTIIGGTGGFGWPGSEVIIDSGDVHTTTFWCGNNANTVTINGLPTIDPVMVASGYQSTLNFNLNGTLQFVNGNPANNGGNLSSYGLGSSGNIVVSGKTYKWQSFNSVSGTCISSGSTYKIINQNSGLALEAPNDWTGNGTQINQWSYYGGASQQWTVTGIGGGIYKIIGVQSGRSLDVAGGGTANGTKVQLYDYWNGASQQWTFTPTDSGYYRITPQCATGSCLDVNGASTANGAIVQLWQWWGGGNQQWSFQAP